ncbi:hypothetical protein, partial [Pseudomonas aeruginosa]|uniref:hypothetical protein n=1 Tax=Pseudomonas aeruginosa TaxID=287 RepID=UPI001C65D9BC
GVARCEQRRLHEIAGIFGVIDNQETHIHLRFDALINRPCGLVFAPAQAPPAGDRIGIRASFLRVDRI